MIQPPSPEGPPANQSADANGPKPYSDGTYWQNVTAAAFSPDEQWIVGPPRGETAIESWSGTRAPAKSSRTMQSPVDGPVAFSPDGKLIIQSGVDDSIYLWNRETGELACRLVMLDDENWAVVDPAGRFDASNGGVRARAALGNQQRADRFGRAQRARLRARACSGRNWARSRSRSATSRHCPIPPWRRS